MSTYPTCLTTRIHPDLLVTDQPTVGTQYVESLHIGIRLGDDIPPVHVCTPEEARRVGILLPHVSLAGLNGKIIVADGNHRTQAYIEECLDIPCVFSENGRPFRLQRTLGTHRSVYEVTKAKVPDAMFQCHQKLYGFRSLTTDL
ncbi:MAG: hypothetical protein OXR66_05055 [Candidatus Woesearchaeota archaeon]|nr:hypothetical protein [Candidatus Woesearchaeota archaeon]